VSPPPRDVFAALVRRALDMHDTWDSPHSFETLHWDGAKLTTMTYVCLMPAIDAVKYPDLMMRAAKEELGRHPEDPAYGYLLLAEGHRVIEPGPDASAAEREQFRRDRSGRTFWKRPDAVETCSVWAADIHGRLWFAEKARNQDGVREAFFGPGGITRDPAIRRMGGPLPDALLAVARTTGILCHGMPDFRRRDQN
jgi:hypothetical protein